MEDLKVIEVFIDDVRIPGGSKEEIESTYEVSVFFFGDGTFTVTGSREKVDAYIEDYGIIC